MSESGEEEDVQRVARFIERGFGLWDEKRRREWDQEARELPDICEDMFFLNLKDGLYSLHYVCGMALRARGYEFRATHEGEGGFHYFFRKSLNDPYEKIYPKYGPDSDPPPDPDDYETFVIG